MPSRQCKSHQSRSESYNIGSVTYVVRVSPDPALFRFSCKRDFHKLNSFEPNAESKVLVSSKQTQELQQNSVFSSFGKLLQSGTHWSDMLNNLRSLRQISFLSVFGIALLTLAQIPHGGCETGENCHVWIEILQDGQDLEFPNSSIFRNVAMFSSDSIFRLMHDRERRSVAFCLLC